MLRVRADVLAGSGVTVAAGGSETVQISLVQVTPLVSLARLA
jgi:hypothetical protein